MYLISIAEPHCYRVHIMAYVQLNIKLDKSCMYIGALAATELIFKSLISRLNLVVCALLCWLFNVNTANLYNLVLIWLFE